MIKLGSPYLTRYGKRIRMNCDFNEDERIGTAFYDVHYEYEEYLSSDRLDAFLIPVVIYAMRHKHDISCDAPITGEILHGLQNYIISSLVQGDKRFYEPKIVSDILPPPHTGGAVGTGMSFGVDSFFVFMQHYKNSIDSLRLTHLCLFNVGAFGSRKGQRNSALKQAKQFSNEVGLPLVYVNSNIHTNSN